VLHHDNLLSLIQARMSTCEKFFRQQRTNVALAKTQVGLSVLQVVFSIILLVAVIFFFITLTR